MLSTRGLNKFNSLQNHQTLTDLGQALQIPVSMKEEDGDDGDIDEDKNKQQQKSTSVGLSVYVEGFMYMNSFHLQNYPMKMILFISILYT